MMLINSNVISLGSLATFRELGPPDLCHTVKSQGRGQKDVSDNSFDE